jgi:hypothetical protein
MKHTGVDQLSFGPKEIKRSKEMKYQNLKLTFALSLFCLAVTLSAVAFAQDDKSKSSATPKLVMAQTEHDFGKVKEGEEPNYTFKVKNEGNADLVIHNVSPACGCTASDFSKTIAPGQEGKITLAVKTAGMNGKVERYAEVISNDKQQTGLKLWLRLEVAKADKN